MAQIKCPKCGAAIPAGSKFCMECGEKIPAAKAASTSSSRPRSLHSAYGNNQSCGGRSDILVRNGFVYTLHRKEDRAEIRVAPLSNEEERQTLYAVQGPGARLSCLNMVEDELIFYEHAEGHRITALNVYSAERREISAGYEVSALWIENGLLSFVENGFLMSVQVNGEGHYEYDLPFRVRDRLIGYNGKLYTADRDTGEAVELTPCSDDYRELGFVAGEDMMYAIIGNLYYAPVEEFAGPVLCCKKLEDLTVPHGIQDVSRLLTAFEQYVIFSRTDEPDYSFAWNIQTLRVYRLNRKLELAPWSFTQVLSDYLMMEQGGKLYKIPAPVFFQGDGDMFTDAYLFTKL